MDQAKMLPGSCKIAAGESALRISRWMPPHLVQRMVQYSAPARPGMTRNTTSEALHCGQSDITCLEDSVAGFEDGCAGLDDG